MRTRGFVVALLFLWVAVGCTGAYFNYNNKRFRDADSALNEQKRFLASIYDQIQPQESVQCQAVLFVIPDYALISEKGIIKDRLSTPEVVDYVTKTVYNDLLFIIDATRKFDLFSNISKIETGSPERIALKKIGEHDIVVYYRVKSPNDQGWVLATSKDRQDSQSLKYDTSLEGFQRVEKWLFDLRHALKGVCQSSQGGRG
jgi:hypothetical protein